MWLLNNFVTYLWESSLSLDAARYRKYGRVRIRVRVCVCVCVRFAILACVRVVGTRMCVRVVGTFENLTVAQRSLPWAREIQGARVTTIAIGITNDRRSGGSSKGVAWDRSKPAVSRLKTTPRLVRIYSALCSDRVRPFSPTHEHACEAQTFYYIHAFMSKPFDESCTQTHRALE